MTVALTASWAFIFTSPVAEAGGLMSTPLVAVPLFSLICFVHFAVGFTVRRPAALSLAALPLVVALAVFRWIPADSDIPAWRTLVVAVAGAVLAPLLVCALAAGVALGRRRAR
ncbi:MAG: hypothetical protein ACJ76Z_03125 [Thermoleophilaceae bacterium]